MLQGAFGRHGGFPTACFGSVGTRSGASLPKSFIGNEGIESTTDMHGDHSFPVPGGRISIGLWVAVLLRSLSGRCDCLTIKTRPGQNTFRVERADRAPVYSTEREPRFAHNRT